MAASVASSLGVNVASAVALGSDVSLSWADVADAVTSAGWVASDVPATENTAVSVRLAVGVTDCAASVGSLPLTEHAKLAANKANAQRISFCLRIGIRSPWRVNDARCIPDPLL